jgi:hypothetical protein
LARWNEPTEQQRPAPMPPTATTAAWQNPYADAPSMRGQIGLAALLEEHAPLPPQQPSAAAKEIDARLAQRSTLDPAPAELQRLPPISDPYIEDPLSPYGEPELEPARQKLSPYKSGFFQKLSISGTWLANGSNPDDLGINEIESYVTVAVPFPIREWPLLITPAFNIRLLTGPSVTDLPPRLYETYVDFMWVPQFLPRLKGLLAVTPSYYSDFQRSDSTAFRVQGKALALYDLMPERLQLVSGLLYLDRDDVVMLPAGGLIWTPNDWIRWELLFPKPKLMSKFNEGLGFEDWVYGTCEWGGNTYAIERLSGLKDHVTWQDFRLLIGVERKLDGGAGYRFEAGYVLGRSVRYLSGNGDFDPADTWLIRGSITF